MMIKYGAIDSLVLHGIEFSEIVKTQSGNTSVGFHSDYVLKIEHYKHPEKYRDLEKEIQIVKYLNSDNCVSCPKIVYDGVLETGERYCIQERVQDQGKPNLADLIFSILEQKSFSVCECDFKKDNLIQNDSVCYIVDYDQAIYNYRFSQLDNISYLTWFIAYINGRWGENFYETYHWDELFDLFRREDASFDLAETSIFKRQITTNSASGIYHTLDTDKIYIKGARGIEQRKSALDKIGFGLKEKVLDVGSNIGLLSHYLCDCSCDVTGIDMDTKIVSGAKMVANILKKKVRFKYLDLDVTELEEEYDTIFLFSVLPHLQNLYRVAINIAGKCRRIIVECGLKEQGFRPIEGKWIKVNDWSFSTLYDLVIFLESIFAGFRYQTCFGKGDRDRYILSFVKK